MLASAGIPRSDSPHSPPSSSSPSTFGSRLLKDPESYMTHNAWDHVEPPASYLSHAASLLSLQAETKIPESTQEELYHTVPASHWDRFYSSHENKFFKDRKWLANEFPELDQLARSEDESIAAGEVGPVGEAKIFEVGCGAGNTVFPLLQRNKNDKLHIYACDYSAEAVSVVKSNPLYKLANGEESSDADTAPTPVTGSVTAFVWDLSSPQGPPTSHIIPGSLDIIVLIFVLSALHPREWDQAIANCHALLKPGGLVLFRDYGRYDLPQLRFKKGRMLDENFYVRGDGTRVYFFTQDELVKIFKAKDQSQSQGREGKEESKGKEEAETPTQTSTYLFDTVQLAVDRRMLVNRKENKQMYRCWMQAKFVKR